MYAEAFNPGTVDSQFERNFDEHKLSVQAAQGMPAPELMWVERQGYLKMLRDYNRLYFAVLQLQKEMDTGNVKVQASTTGKPAYNEYLRITREILGVENV